MPKVSVVTAAFNASETLSRAAASLRSQTFKDWEHLVVNDGSQDITAYWLRRYQILEPRAHVVHTPNRGQALALNSGAVKSQGDYITFLDADDEYSPEHLAKHVTYMQMHPEIDLLWGGLEVIVDSPEQAYLPDMERQGGLIHAEECCITGTLFMRRHVFEVFRFVNDRDCWHQDYDFLQRAQLQFKTEKFSEPTYRYYRNTGASIVDKLLSQ